MAYQDNMSAGQLSRHRSVSRSSHRSGKTAPSMPPNMAPAPSMTPKQDDFTLEPCAATASFFIYAQRSTILCCHHDTLAIERRFQGHREDVLWISVDNVSERGAGRLVVSYDTGNTAIVWDLLNGQEVARFASYEEIRVAAWMRNGNVAFGNSQGNVILFEPSTSEHISARTIFDPITALAPVSDCRAFAIGYMNGSILIATLQPAFTIIHTLTTPRTPSPITNLAWHGSSSRQKSEMLAVQTQDGDLRVWSVPKAPHGDAPCVIRILGKTDVREVGPVWFGWSKSGRIVQFSEGQTYSWDVRTKRVTCEPVPTVDNVRGIAGYGPTASLFTLGHNHTIQQYDINPQGTPSLVQNVQHVPANTPPSPPNSIEEMKAQQQDSSSISSRSNNSTPANVPYGDTGSSEGEGMAAMSPLQKIAQEMDQIEEEMRDRVGPLSPTSSRASMSSRSSGGGRRPRYRYDKPSSSRASNQSSEGTVFSFGGATSVRSGHESVSIRSSSSTTSSNYKPSSLSREYRRPEKKKEPESDAPVDLFPFTRARLSDVPFRSPRYTPERTNDELRQQMLYVVFGWEDEIDSLIRDELARHQPGTAGAVLLSKWLGDDNSDLMASMIGSDNMSSSDWMLLALSAMGQGGSQKKVGQAYTQRLLEKGDIHPAVAILLGLGDPNDAIEVYVSRKYYMEAVILTCLLFPNDWQRQSFLVRKWGESAVSHKQPELAVRCFSCTSLESAEPWFSPTAQDAVFTAQKQQVLGSQLSPPLSPPGVGMPSRLKNASLKLVTNFNTGGAGPVSTTDEKTPMVGMGVTPIAESAISPGGAAPWLRPTARGVRDPSSARTATPGAYARRKRFPSRPDHDRGTPVEATPVARHLRRDDPQTAIEREPQADFPPVHHRSTSASVGTSASRSLADEPLLLSAVAYDPTKSMSKQADSLPSPAVGVFTALKERSRSRNGSRSRKPEDLQLNLGEIIIKEDLPSGVPSIVRSETTPPLTGASMASYNSLKSAKIRSIDQFISSLDEANHFAREQRAVQRAERAESRKRGTSREPKSRSRQASETRGRAGVRYIKPAKRSPSSPVSMSPDDARLFTPGLPPGLTPGLTSAPIRDEDDAPENYYNIASPVESTTNRSFTGRARSRSRAAEGGNVRASSRVSRKARSPEGRTTKPSSRATSRTRTREPSQDRSQLAGDRGRTLIVEGSHARSPSSPLPMNAQAQFYRDDEEGAMPVENSRQRSRSRRPNERGVSTSRREQSTDRRAGRDRSQSRRPGTRETSRMREPPLPSPDSVSIGSSRRANALPKLKTDLATPASILSKKELAARELEERRLSLARRPSAPVIPLPGDLALHSGGRPKMSPRSNTDGMSPIATLPSTTFLPSTSYADRVQRSHTVDPEALQNRYGPRTTGTSTPSVRIGLPATPRAMRHPRYMSADPDERDVPEVPQIPVNLQQASPRSERSMNAHEDDHVAPLLPATTFGQTFTKPPSRSASVPLERHEPAVRSGNSSSGLSRRGSVNSQGHARGTSYSGLSPTSSNGKRISPTFHSSIDEALNESQVIIVDAGATTPPVLPELQHLTMPPPPPPPPAFPPNNGSPLGVINIAIDEKSGSSAAVIDVQPLSAGSTSPQGHRRGRGSVSESIGGRLRGVTDRMRSASRSRAKSPPIESYGQAPYESIPAMPTNARRPSLSQQRALSSEDVNNLIPPPPPMHHGQMEQVIPPGAQQPQGYMRKPQEIRANMPPNVSQLGAVEQGGMI